MKSPLIAVCLFIALATNCFGQVKLEHKIEPGNKFTVDASVQIDQTLTIKGTDVVTKIEYTSTSNGTVGKRDDEGKIRAGVKIESLQININAGGQEYLFDSANPDKAGGSALEVVRPIHKAMVGSESTIVYDKNNKVVAVENDKDALGGLSVETQALAGSQLDPEYQKKQAQQQLDQIPSDPVKQGDSWDRTSVADLGAKQIMTFVTRYTYEGTVEKNNESLDKITAKTTSVSLEIGEGSPSPVKLKESKLKVADSNTEIFFSRKRGLIIEGKSTIHITGDLTLTAGEQELPSKLDLTFKVESAVRQ